MCGRGRCETRSDVERPIPKWETADETSSNRSRTAFLGTGTITSGPIEHAGRTAGGTACIVAICPRLAGQKDGASYQLGWQST